MKIIRTNPSRDRLPVQLGFQGAVVVYLWRAFLFLEVALACLGAFLFLPVKPLPPALPRLFVLLLVAAILSLWTIKRILAGVVKDLRAKVAEIRAKTQASAENVGTLSPGDRRLFFSLLQSLESLLEKLDDELSWFPLGRIRVLREALSKQTPPADVSTS